MPGPRRSATHTFCDPDVPPLTNQAPPYNNGNHGSTGSPATGAQIAEFLKPNGTVQQFIAYEKCYKVTGGYQNCVAAHEPLSYTDKYPLTKNSWMGPNGSRMAEITLAPGERTRKP